MLELNENTTVRDVLIDHPETFEIFLAHGMCEDCKTNPPPVPLHHFAQKHCQGNIRGLIAELNQIVRPG